MGNIEDNGTFRYRTFVKIIAILDIVFALFLLGFYLLRLAFYEGGDGDMTSGIFYKYGLIKDIEPLYYFIEEMHKYYMFIWVSFFFIYTVQLVSGIILLFGSCQGGPEEAQRRCKSWCSSLSFLKTTIGIEFFILLQTFAKFGFRYPAFSLWAAKLIFRLLAERVVRAHLKDLATIQIYSYGASDLYKSLMPTTNHKY